MTLREALKSAEQRLSATSATSRLDAELLAAHALGVDRNYLLLNALDTPVPDCFWQLVERRAASEPVAYITGTADFWDLTLQVNPHVLIPRPDSETLIEAAVGFYGTRSPQHILDLGTGSGALLLAALGIWTDAFGLGVDRSSNALEVARRNAENCGLAARARFDLGDWGQTLLGSFDLILCNPPYIAANYPLAPDVLDYEPHEALFAGVDGLDDYRRLAPVIAEHLSSDGCACVEIGFDQGRSAADIFTAAGLNVTVLPDIGGNDRCLQISRNP